MLLKFLLVLSAFEPLSRWYTSHNHNVCKHFLDYYYPYHNENCYYDPDTTMDTPQLIEKYAGSVETHSVTTEDGYILTMFRIPRTNPRGVILLHHSIATYSHIYLWQGNNSLAMTLWHSGFDVWLANQRGTSYSDKHVNLTSSDFSYWNFSFHEMGLYDITSEAELIQSKTNGSKIIYFGHSLGSAMALVYASLKPLEAQKYLKAMVLLGTPAYFQHATSYIFMFLGVAPLLKWLMDLLGIGSPLRFLSLFLSTSRIILRLFPFLLFIVCALIWAFCGYTPAESDPTFFNYDGLIYENNFSWKTLTHFAQLAGTKSSFQMYDYGTSGNRKAYGQDVPPQYPLEEVAVPTLLVSSYNDTLVSLRDCDYLYERLSQRFLHYGHWKAVGLNHLDFHLGLHRKEIFVDRLLDFLKRL